MRLVPKKNGDKKKRGLDRFDYVNLVLEGRLAGYMSEMRREGYQGVMVVEDGAPIHQNKLADAAREELHIKSLTHPPSSPDLNAIEPLWGVLKSRVGKLVPVASNIEMLWTQVSKVWNEMEQDLVDRQMERMESRRHALLRAKGMQTGFLTA